MMGFAYLTPQEVTLSIWLFYLLGYALKGYFTYIGLSRSLNLDIYGQSDGGPILSYVQFGALMALTGYTLWTARKYLRGSWRAAVHGEGRGRGEFSCAGCTCS